MKSDPKIVELDFGMGNIRSLQKAFEFLGKQVNVIQQPDQIKNADAVLIPGDGAFGQAMENIKKTGFYDAIIDFVNSGKPVLGICIGFQILFHLSDEFNYTGNGLSLFEGNIEKFKSKEIVIPHMGWNQVSWEKKTKFNKDVPDESYFYFVHSYRFGEIHKYATGVTEYDGKFTSVVEKDNIYGVQFHPEKSYRMGLKLLENFIGLI
ncbi:MAG: imidazole glycerol phosphate synthase subunit HisH [Spirochaetia bacterium]|nr:imidazole glycerol phosphate synthase subunit HisH [Spirochaetia bacterium]